MISFVLRFVELKKNCFLHKQCNVGGERKLIFDAQIFYQTKIQELNHGWIEKAQIRIEEAKQDYREAIIAFDKVTIGTETSNLITLFLSVSSDTFVYLLNSNNQKIEMSAIVNPQGNDENKWKMTGIFPQWNSSISAVQKVQDINLSVEQ